MSEVPLQSTRYSVIMESSQPRKIPYILHDKGREQKFFLGLHNQTNC